MSWINAAWNINQYIGETLWEIRSSKIHYAWTTFKLKNTIKTFGIFTISRFTSRMKNGMYFYKFISLIHFYYWTSISIITAVYYSFWVISDFRSCLLIQNNASYRRLWYILIVWKWRYAVTVYFYHEEVKRTNKWCTVLLQCFFWY